MRAPLFILILFSGIASCDHPKDEIEKRASLIQFDTTLGRPRQIDTVIEYQDGTYWLREYYFGTNKIVAEYRHKDSFATGLFRLYNRDGSIAGQGYMDSGNSSGMLMDFNDSRDSNYINSLGIIYNERKIGQWSFFFSDGKVDRVEEYDSSGNRIYGVYFSTEGRLEREFINGSERRIR